MLKQKKRVADALLFPRFDDTPLDFKRLCVGDAAETEQVNQHGGARR
ncbi:MAG: hypothetical protein NVSMB3_00290 [Acidobacteriaceae bacterium]